MASEDRGSSRGRNTVDKVSYYSRFRVSSLEFSSTVLCEGLKITRRVIMLLSSRCLTVAELPLTCRSPSGVDSKGASCFESCTLTQSIAGQVL